MGIAGIMVLFLLGIQASFFQAYQIGRLVGFFKKNIFNFGLKGVIEKCVGCCLVHLYIYFFIIIIKRYYGIEGLIFCGKRILRNAAIHTTQKISVFRHFSCSHSQLENDLRCSYVSQNQLCFVLKIRKNRLISFNGNKTSIDNDSLTMHQYNIGPF